MKTSKAPMKIVRGVKVSTQLIPREGLQSYSLGVGPLPTQGPTTPYACSPRGPQYKNSLTPHPPPAVETLATTDVETGPKLREH
jgi:hypothetical protein